MRDYFYSLADDIDKQLKADEVFTCLFQGEDSNFTRLNKNQIRHAGHVKQLELTLDIIQGRRHAGAQFSLSGRPDHDRRLITYFIETLRARRNHLEDDPYLLFATEVYNTDDSRPNRLPDARTAIPEIIEVASELDLVGIWASGQQYQGFANSLGQRNWYSTHSFNFDWSCYLTGDKAVKSNYAGTEWDTGLFQHTIDEIRLQLNSLNKPSRSVSPGHYRTYLAPAALHEIVSMMSWGGFGLKSHRTQQTPLIKMVQDGRRLDSRVTIVENHAEGLAAGFTPSGFIKPPQVDLIVAGNYHDCLVSPRSSREYGEPVNAAFEILKHRCGRDREH